VNARAGFYRFTVEALNQTVTLWRTLIHISNYQPASLPFAHTWKRVNYTFEGRTLNATHLDDYLSIIYPTVPFPYTATLFSNNMSFLIRLSGATWAVDVTYFTMHMGLKWILNGTIPDERSFDFQCSNNPSKTWVTALHEFKSLNTHLTFSWKDLALEQHAFVFNATTQVLTVTIPDSGEFKIDPVIFEDGFEGGNPEYGDWDSTTTGGDAELWYSSTWAHCGVNSSRSNSSNDGASRQAFATKNVVYNNSHTRFYFRIEQIGASSANMYLVYLRAGSWRGFSVGLQTANNNITMTWYNGSTGDNTILSNCWNTSETYLVEAAFHRETNPTATDAWWGLWINQTSIYNATDLDNDFQTDYVNVGHSGNFRSGWTVSYIDCVVIDDEYIGAEGAGQDVTFTLSESVTFFAAMTPNGEWAFQLSSTLHLFSANLANAALGFTFTGSLNLHASSTARKELGFIFGEVLHFASSMASLIETVALDLTFILTETLRLHASSLASFELSILDLSFTLFEAVHFHATRILAQERRFTFTDTLQFWDRMTPTFEGVSFELAFILFESVVFFSTQVAPVVVRGVTSTTLMLMGVCFVIALAALAIAASKRD